MDALGWQIGATLIGASALIIGIYIAKILNSATKITDKVFKIVDYNERHIHETIENMASITRNTDQIMDLVSNVTSVTRIFKIFKK
jgi:uncharacterized protein YoxC